MRFILAAATVAGLTIPLLIAALSKPIDAEHSEAATFIVSPHPRGYVSYRTEGQLKIDGRLDESGWQAVPWTEPFVDVEGDARPVPRYRTRVKMLWDDDYLYVGAELEEPHVWATLTRHDSYIFHDDNDFEVFID